MGPKGESQPILTPALARKLALSSTKRTRSGSFGSGYVSYTHLTLPTKRIV